MGPSYSPKGLSSAPFEPLEKASLRDLSSKTVFLLALASSKRVSEIHAISREVRHSEHWTSVTLSTVPSFVAKTQDPSVDDPRFGSFKIPALKKEQGKRPLLCPVRALKRYLKVTEGKRQKCLTLFLNPVKSDTSVAKNTLSFWLRETITRTGAPVGDKTPRAHSVRGIGTSLQFARNRSLQQVLKAGTWNSHNTFTNAYLREFSTKYLNKFSLELGPIVAAQGVVTGPSSCTRT